MESLIDNKTQNFIIVDKFNNNVKLICPFEKIGDSYINGISVPINRKHRINKIQEIIPEFCNCVNIGNDIAINCCNNIEQEMFNNINNGLIMLNISMINKNNNNNQIGNVYDADDILLLKKCGDKYRPCQVELDMDDIKVNQLKVLPIILYDGFIMGIVNRYESTIYISLKNPKKKIVGKCGENHGYKINNFYSKIWPIFENKINDGKTEVSLNLDFEFDEETPIVIKLTKNFNHINKMVKIEKIFETVS